MAKRVLSAGVNRLHPSELRGLQLIVAPMMVGLAIFLGTMLAWFPRA